MKVVVDTNVLVSGILSVEGPPGRIVDLIISSDLQVYFNGKILAEYDSVFKRPELTLFGPFVTSLLTQIVAAGESVPALPITRHLPDPTDEMFLDVALTGQVECLITGNLKHFPPLCRRGVRVLSPREFLEFYRDQQDRSGGKVKSPSAKYRSKKRRTRSRTEQPIK